MTQMKNSHYISHNTKFKWTFRDGNLKSQKDAAGLIATGASPTKPAVGPQGSSSV